MQGRVGLSSRRGERYHMQNQRKQRSRRLSWIVGDRWGRSIIAITKSCLSWAMSSWKTTMPHLSFCFPVQSRSRLLSVTNTKEFVISALASTLLVVCRTSSASSLDSNSLLPYASLLQVHASACLSSTHTQTFAPKLISTTECSIYKCPRSHTHESECTQLDHQGPMPYPMTHSIVQVLERRARLGSRHLWPHF
jgi:hypothetical protein